MHNNAEKAVDVLGKAIDDLIEERDELYEKMDNLRAEQETELESLRGSLDEWKADFKAIESELTKLLTELDDEAASCKLWQKRATLFERRAIAAEEMKDRLRNELTQLRAEVEQYQFLLEQAKTLRRDNMILRQAIESHRRNVWGEIDADHDQDIELYKALDSIDNSSTDVSEDLS